jgi:hypothetical protein
MQYYSYRIERKVYMCNIFKDTCLIALKKKIRVLIYLDLEILVYLVFKVFVYLILKSSYHDSEMNSPNAQAYNHTNTTIIRI